MNPKAALGNPADTTSQSSCTSAVRVVCGLRGFHALTLAHNLTLTRILQLAVPALLLTAASAGEIGNGGFENGLSGWKTFWTRVPAAGTVAVDQQVVHGGKQSARIEHRGERDWSFEPAERVAVQPGDLFEMDAWLQLKGQGSATLCVATLDAAGSVLDWSFGARTAHQQTNWFRLATRFVVPNGITQIQPRLIGSDAATVWLDDFSIAKRRNLSAARRSGLPDTLSLSNATLSVTLRTADGTLVVSDRRTGQKWSQKAVTPDVAVMDVKPGPGYLRLKLLHLSSGSELTAALRLEAERPEFTVELDGSGQLPAALKFPYPFLSQSDQYLVIPMNEGISYPVDDESIEPMRLIAYGGHGICMAFWGVTDGAKSHMAILETPNDAAIRIDRTDGKLTVAPEWESEKGQFGYARRLRYLFFDGGGHVAMCKRYRTYARQIDLLKTLAEKRQANSNVDLLIGAVNVWCWDNESIPVVKEMQTLGIDRILWSNRQSPENLRVLNELGVLTSRYDIYQDVMDPDNFKHLRGVHPDWTTEAWPKDLMIGSDGHWIKGWEVEGRDHQRYPCGVLCDRLAPDYARRRIPAELVSHPYCCRFIDTTTASPWRECYAPDHPLTRGESRHWKMELLRCVSDEMKLVTGCETGHDASVPFVHYFEGMLSLGPYRVPDSGRDMQRIWTEVPERVAKFQVGHQYRLPLWELVFHDCVVAQWYWGDYNNKLPALWDKRDLINLLYGTPPMFMCSRALWEQNQARFVQSYKTICPTVRSVGYSEMVDHRFLTQDRDVQQTVFANGVTVTVNFGHHPFRLNDSVTVAAMQSHVAGGPDKL